VEEIVLVMSPKTLNTPEEQEIIIASTFSNLKPFASFKFHLKGATILSFSSYIENKKLS
jgi:hypothetical protein